MKSDIEHLNRLAERLDYKPDSQQHKDNLAEYCNSDRMMSIAKEYRALEQRAETAEAEVQRLNATAQPVSDGWVSVPRSLTAENGAKAALFGEFSVQQNIICHECFGEGCDDCNGQGNWTNNVPVDWTTIKEIWAKGVEHFLAAAPGGQDS